MKSPLRELTRAEHARVDSLYSRFSLDTPSGYASFLLAQGAAYCSIEAELDRSGVERWIDDWPARSRRDLLLADLTELGVQAPGSDWDRRLERPSEMLGAAYVLEGSRLGGRLLARQLYPGAPRRFLDAAGPPAAWPRLLSLLNRNLVSPTELEAAASAAKDCFRCFERAAQQNEEPELA